MARLLDMVLVVDVESTCWEGPPPPGQASEIIEVGLCPVDLRTLERTEKRSILVKPVQSEISDFCTSLTTLTPDMFADATTLADAVRTLKKEFRSKDRLWVSWGDYDRRQFERACKDQRVGSNAARRITGQSPVWNCSGVGPLSSSCLRSSPRL